MNNWVLQFLKDETKTLLVLQNILFILDEDFYIPWNSRWRDTKEFYSRILLFLRLVTQF